MKRKRWFFVIRERSTDRLLKSVELSGNPDKNPVADKEERHLWCGINHDIHYWDVEEHGRGTSPR